MGTFASHCIEELDTSSDPKFHMALGAGFYIYVGQQLCEGESSNECATNVSPGNYAIYGFNGETAPTNGDTPKCIVSVAGGVGQVTAMIVC